MKSRSFVPMNDIGTQDDGIFEAEFHAAMFKPTHCSRALAAFESAKSV